MLLDYHWPGNVRELENIITRASVLATGPAVGADELRPWLIQAGETRNSGTDSAQSMGLRLEDMERKMIEATLDRYAGHRAKTAEALGIGIAHVVGKTEGLWLCTPGQVNGQQSSLKLEAVNGSNRLSHPNDRQKLPLALAAIARTSGRNELPSEEIGEVRTPR